MMMQSRPFAYTDGVLHCDGVPLPEIAQAVGTPTYVYSADAISRNVSEYREALGDRDHLICYALKANYNPEIVRLLGELGCGVEVVSGGELELALKCRIPGERIVFAGVGKTADEIAFAVRNEIYALHIESEPEFDAVCRIAAESGIEARVGFRVNPDIDARTHPYISTALKTSKFGLDRETVRRLYREAHERPWVRPVGLHMHIGSGIDDVGPFAAAAECIAGLAASLREEDLPVEYMDFGGGLGIPMAGGIDPPPRRRLVESLLRRAADFPGRLVLEPGRSIIGDAGALVCRVVYVKKTGLKTFLIVDSGMNDLLRPALYSGIHPVQPVVIKYCETDTYDIVGPVCESGDFLRKDFVMERQSPGDCIAVLSCGAYGYSMSSNYNLRPRPAEVLVEGDVFRVIRPRETLPDLG